MEQRGGSVCSCYPKNRIAKPSVNFRDLRTKRVRLGYGRRDDHSTEKGERVAFQPSTANGGEWYSKKENIECGLDYASTEAHPARNRRRFGVLIDCSPQHPQNDQRQNTDAERLVQLAFEIAS